MPQGSKDSDVKDESQSKVETHEIEKDESQRDIAERERVLEDTYLQANDPEFFRECGALRARIQQLKDVKDLFVSIKKGPDKKPRGETAPVQVKEEDVTDETMAARKKEYEEITARREKAEEAMRGIRKLTHQLLEKEKQPAHQVVRAVAPKLLMVSAEAQSAASDYKRCKAQYAAEYAVYEKKITSQFGLESMNELYSKQYKIPYEIRKQKRQAFGFGRIRNRVRIKQMQQESDALVAARDKLSRINSDVRGYDASYSSEARLYDLDYCRDQISYAIDDEIRSILDAMPTVEEKEQEKEGSAEVIEIPEQVQESTLRQFLGNNVWEKNEKKKQKIIERIAKVVLPLIKDEKPELETIAIIDKELDPSETNTARDALRVLKSFEEAAGKFSELMPRLPRIRKREALLEEITKIASSLGSDVADYRFVIARKELTENCGEAFIGNTVGWWADFRLLCEEKYGKEFKEYADKQVGTIVQNVVLTTGDWDGRDKRVPFSRALLDFPQQEFIPVAVLNAYREPGYSGERPLMGHSMGVRGEDSPIAKYVKGLSESTIESLRKTEPDIAEIIDEIRKNPDKAFNHSMEGDGGEWVDSPVYKRIHRIINNYSLAQLESGKDLDTKAVFFMECFVIDKDTPEATDRMLAVYNKLPDRARLYFINDWATSSITNLSVSQQVKFLEHAKNETASKRGEDAASIVARGMKSFDSSLRGEIVKMAIQSNNRDIISILWNQMDALGGIEIDLVLRHDLVKNFINHQMKYPYELDKMRAVFEKEYASIIEENKKLVVDKSLPVKERVKERGSAAMLLANAARCDKELENYYTSILGKDIGKEKEASLTPEQRAAIFIFQRLDNPDSNEALFRLIANPNISLAAKNMIGRTLFGKGRAFIDPKVRSALDEWRKLPRKKTEIPWQDLSFLSAIRNSIPSVETQRKSMDAFGDVFREVAIKDFSLGEKGKANLYELWEKSYSSIPQEAFVQSYDWAQGDLGRLGKINEMYRIIKKEGTTRENLLDGLVNTRKLEMPLASEMKAKILSFEYKTKGDVERFSSFLKKMIFLDTVQAISRKEQKVIAPTQERINSISKAKNFEELEIPMNQELREGINTFFGGNVSWETVEAVQEKWGSFEPILRYSGRYSELRQYVGEMVNVFSSEEEWKKWRYNKENPAVKDQLEGLSDKQCEIWIKNASADLGSIEFAGSSLEEKPKQIMLTMRDAVMTHRHIAGNEGEGQAHQFIQKILESLYSEFGNEVPTLEAVNTKLQELERQEVAVNALLQIGSIERINKTLAEIFPKGKSVLPTKKTKDAIAFLAQFLPDEISDIKKKYAEYEKDNKKPFSTEELITSEIRQHLEERISTIQKICEETKRDKNFSASTGLTEQDLGDLKKLQMLRKEMRIARDLFRLNKVTAADLAQNRFVEAVGKEGETISGMIENLQKSFEVSPFLQDLKNIDFTIKGEETEASKKHFAAIFTDDPRMLWQGGGYPKGSGSCQNYIDGSHARNLMGYVGDANAKVLYLFDIDALPEEKRKLVLREGLQKALPDLSPEDMLGASVARSMIKMIRTDAGPGILIEPTYTSHNKGDKSLDVLIDSFIRRKVANLAKLRIARSGGNRSFTKGKSRSSQGQYEDVHSIDWLPEQ